MTKKDICASKVSCSSGKPYFRTFNLDGQI